MTSEVVENADEPSFGEGQKTKAGASGSHSTAMKSPLSQFAGQYQEWLSVAPLRDQLSRVWVNDLTVSAAKDY